MTVPTERDQQTAQGVVLSVETDYDLSGDDYEAVIAAVAVALVAERERVLAPFRALEDDYPLGSDVPVYRIGRAIEQAAPATSPAALPE